MYLVRKTLRDSVGRWYQKNQSIRQNMVVEEGKVPAVVHNPLHFLLSDHHSFRNSTLLMPALTA